MSVTSVRLQPELVRRLDGIAAKMHRSKSWLINQALREYMQRQADEQERWQQTLAALDDAAQGRVLPAKEVHAWLRSWGRKDEARAPKAKR